MMNKKWKTSSVVIVVLFVIGACCNFGFVQAPPNACFAAEAGVAVPVSVAPHISSPACRRTGTGSLGAGFPSFANSRTEFWRL